jgi:hypothetical protein
LGKETTAFLAGGHLAERQAVIAAIMDEPWAHPVTLLREPDNPFDANAVKVLVPGGQIGYIAASLAAEMAQRMDSGRCSYIASIADVVPNKQGKLNVRLGLYRVDNE